MTDGANQGDGGDRRLMSPVATGASDSQTELWLLLLPAQEHTTT